MRLLLAILFFFSASTNVEAQINLVKNSGFEQYSQCPNFLDQIKYAIYWNGIDTNWSPGDSLIYDPPCLPEYINECSTDGNSSAPVNAKFYQYPHKGNGMTQVWMYWD